MKNREIKFQIWDKENNCFYEPTYEAYKGNLEEILMSPSGDLNIRTFKKGTTIEILYHESKFPDRFIKRQFTGLKDKDGKEAYHKDIIEYWMDYGMGDNRRFVEIIEYEGGAFYPVCNIPCDEWKIIGNIYSNPELIKE